MEAYETLRKHLAAGWVNVNFKKINGEKRAMVCTTNPELIPAEQLSEGAGRKVNPDVVAAWDLNAEGWRSFRLDRVRAYVSSATAIPTDVPGISLNQIVELREWDDIV